MAWENWMEEINKGTRWNTPLVCKRQLLILFSWFYCCSSMRQIALQIFSTKFVLFHFLSFSGTVLPMHAWANHCSCVVKTGFLFWQVTKYRLESFTNWLGTIFYICSNVAYSVLKWSMPSFPLVSTWLKIGWVRCQD